MSYFLTHTVAKRTMSLVAQQAPRALTAAAPVRPMMTRRFFSVEERVPDEDYVDGHLINDHLEYLDDMIDKTLEIETNMERLKETYSLKRKAYNESASLEEMEHLFLQAEEQKRLISAQIASLKSSLQLARSAPTGFAVDGPDGTSDELEQLYSEEVNELLEKTTGKPLPLEKGAKFAVDAPDGTSDELEGLYVEEAKEILNEATREESMTMKK